MARVAWAYHVEGLTQHEVARKLGVTRLRVNRALREARRSGLVRITFNSVYAACAELEADLSDRFQLKFAHVAPARSDSDDIQNLVGAALGGLLSELLSGPEIKLFGMSWGGTLNIATRYMSALDRPDLEIVSVMGGLTRGSDLNSFEITSRIAGLANARHSLFPAPLYAGSRSSRDIIMQIDVFAEVLNKIRSVDAIALAAGDMSGQSLLMRDGLPSDTSMQELCDAGAVGDLLGIVIGADGKPIGHPLNERVIGIGLDDLMPIPNVILAAGGLNKLPVVRALLGLNIVDTLVTDEVLARKLLE